MIIMHIIENFGGLKMTLYSHLGKNKLNLALDIQ
jgi:hypothetical protein